MIDPKAVAYWQQLCASPARGQFVARDAAWTNFQTGVAADGVEMKVAAEKAKAGRALLEKEDAAREVEADRRVLIRFQHDLQKDLPLIQKYLSIMRVGEFPADSCYELLAQISDLRGSVDKALDHDNQSGAAYSARPAMGLLETATGHCRMLAQTLCSYPNAGHRLSAACQSLPD